MDIAVDQDRHLAGRRVREDPLLAPVRVERNDDILERDVLDRFMAIHGRNDHDE